MAESIRKKTLEDWRLEAALCIERIYKQDYFVWRWEMVKHKLPLAEYTTRAELLKPFQDFWEALPDSKNIRRDPFFDICALAEAYCFEDE